MATIKKACKGTLYPKSSSVSKKLKTGGGFPDLNKDGKVTKKDILIGKGVLPKTAKKGMKVKKAQVGKKVTKFIEDVGSKGTKAVVEGAKRVGAGLGIDRFKQDVAKMDSAYNAKKQSVKKQKMGGKTTASMMKKGGKMTKKCAYGCK